MTTAWVRALALAVALVAVAFPTGLLVLVRRRATAATAGGAPGPLELARLAGGPQRVVETVITLMYDDGRIRVTTDGLIKVLSPVTYDAVERALLACCGDRWHCTIGAARTKVEHAAALSDLESALVAKGLLAPAEPDPPVRRAERRHTAALTAAAFLALAGSLAPGSRTVPFALLACVACGVAVRLVTRVPWSRPTRAGRRALRAAHPKGLAGAVALDGPAALPKGLLREQLLRTAPQPPRRPSATDGGYGSCGACCDPGHLP
ncbi:TIGR04222 domain-containing membrane protein [Streptomyces sp. UNOC14_S4]|uniref:TIGR04222 domain-containing membrane protein n=1 Tax=Streptomyces sp. UNOC14_S4 TaxID=2872340 RepID=UPI001E60A689|nr:TIGR04222 domain-containing membrane protein [Streptomyces sp. UNOC14_S4]MCC3772496.1 TIGR04222 domain-containing membrane protein [Streptomyces sp. UNOC14_S4]